MPVSKAKAQLNFANGYSTTCTKWNPLSHSPTPTSAGKLKKCSFERTSNKGQLAQKFAAGQTIDIALGRISGSSAGAGGDASTLSSGTLRMTRSGRIEIGKFSGFSFHANGAYAAGRSRRTALIGQYYLNGHTITIRTDKGEVYHGFIAATSRDGSGKIDDVFINGEHYWDRSK